MNEKDYFEDKVINLLKERNEYIKTELLKKKEEEDNNENYNIQDRIPFDIANTLKYIKQEEYIRNKNHLKNKRE